MSDSLPNEEPAQPVPRPSSDCDEDRNEDTLSSSTAGQSAGGAYGDGDEDALLVTQALAKIAACQSCEVDFEAVYGAAYRLVYDVAIKRLVAGGQGLRLHAILEASLGRMALCKSEKQYHLAVGMIADVCYYLQRLWMPDAHSGGAIPHGTIAALAKAVFDRPVTRRWRRIRRLCRAVASTSRSLMIYNEAMFAPGAPGAEQCAKRFKARAAGTG
tara:strand:- start:1645 stop:2289 length:645 start_codon:yes stop_codon:yes gene_type:complete